MLKLVKQVQGTSNVFEEVPGQMHQHFPYFKANSIGALKIEDVTYWMRGQLQNLSLTC